MFRSILQSNKFASIGANKILNICRHSTQQGQSQYKYRNGVVRKSNVYDRAEDNCKKFGRYLVEVVTNFYVTKPFDPKVPVRAIEVSRDFCSGASKGPIESKCPVECPPEPPKCEKKVIKCMCNKKECGSKKEACDADPGKKKTQKLCTAEVKCPPKTDANEQKCRSKPKCPDKEEKKDPCKREEPKCPPPKCPPKKPDCPPDFSEDPCKQKDSCPSKKESPCPCPPKPKCPSPKPKCPQPKCPPKKEDPCRKKPKCPPKKPDPCEKEKCPKKSDKCQPKCPPPPKPKTECPPKKEDPCKKKPKCAPKEEESPCGKNVTKCSRESEKKCDKSMVAPLAELTLDEIIEAQCEELENESLEANQAEPESFDYDIFKVVDVLDTTHCKQINEHFGDQYDNKEYYMYHPYSFHDLTRHMSDKRCPLPSAIPPPKGTPVCAQEEDDI